MTGLETYKTKSGIQVAKVHYTSDPDKDPSTPTGRAWMDRALTGVKGGSGSSGWRREMEIDFDALAGEKIFEGLELLKDKIFVNPIEIQDWWKIEGGYDYGKRNPFSYHDYTIDGDGNIYAIFEAYGSGYDVPQQAILIKKSPFFKRQSSRHADPSIWTEDKPLSAGGFTSIQNLFDENGINFIRGLQSDLAAVDRFKALIYDTVFDDVLMRVVDTPKDNPRFKCFRVCPELWNELVNLRWADFSPKIEESKGKKEEIAQTKNHAWDDLKYFLLSLPDSSFELEKPPKKGSVDEYLKQCEKEGQDFD